MKNHIIRWGKIYGYGFCIIMFVFSDSLNFDLYSLCIGLTVGFIFIEIDKILITKEREQLQELKEQLTRLYQNIGGKV